MGHLFVQTLPLRTERPRRPHPAERCWRSGLNRLAVQANSSDLPWIWPRFGKGHWRRTRSASQSGHGRVAKCAVCAFCHAPWPPEAIKWRWPSS